MTSDYGLAFLIEWAIWGVLGMALAGTLLGLVAQLVPVLKTGFTRLAVAVPARPRMAAPVRTPAVAPKSACLRPAPGRVCVLRVTDDGYALAC